MGLIGEETENTFKTYHFDYRGSTVAITDSTGAVTDTFQYDTYGKQTARTGTSEVIFGYNGRDVRIWIVVTELYKQFLNISHVHSHRSCNYY